VKSRTQPPAYQFHGNRLGVVRPDHSLNFPLADGWRGSFSRGSLSGGLLCCRLSVNRLRADAAGLSCLDDHSVTGDPPEEGAASVNVGKRLTWPALCKDRSTRAVCNVAPRRTWTMRTRWVPRKSFPRKRAPGLGVVTVVPHARARTAARCRASLSGFPVGPIWTI